MPDRRDSHFDGKPIDLFKRKREGTIDRILKRAEKTQQKQFEKQQRELSHSLGNKGLLTKLGKTLDKIVAHQGRTSKNRPSIRLKVPGTGATSFHFSYKTVTKSESKRHGSKAANTGTTRPNATKARGKAGEKTMTNTAIAAIKHQAYVERMDEAPTQANAIDPANRPIDQSQAAEQDGPPLGTDTDQTTADKTVDWTLSPDQQNEFHSGMSPALAQILADAGLSPTIDGDEQHPAGNKDRAPLYGTTQSFGNIAPTYDERLLFWETFTEQNPASNDITATSMPLDAATTEAEQLAHIARHAAKLADDNVPFWITIREPSNAPDAEKRAYILSAPTPLETTTNEDGEITWNLGAKKPSRQHRAKNIRKEIENRVLDQNPARANLSATQSCPPYRAAWLGAHCADRRLQLGAGRPACTGSAQAATHLALALGSLAHCMTGYAKS